MSVYLDLLRLHICDAISKEMEEERRHPIVGETRSQVKGECYAEDIKGYFEVLPGIVEKLHKRWGWKKSEVLDLWALMMLRALCWGACHFFVPGGRVPTAYYGSQLPVYIG